MRADDRLRLLRGALLLSFLCGAAALPAQHEGVTPEPDEATATPESSAPVDFLRDVRPILSQNCFPCHGPDEARRKADLRLDRKDSAFANRDGFPVLVPGNVEESFLLEMVATDDPLDRMPPPDDGEKLSAEEIDILRRWVAQGAVWDEHWAFTAPTRPELPEETTEEWSRSPIDRFVRAHLGAHELEPAPPAGKEAWLRRVTFDLTGLAPTIEELEKYLADDSASAEETVVDRLLASPRFGERQAQEWLDIARYADTNGYQRDSDRQMWKWREWVIEAYNANKRYDQFIIEQLAGDLLPGATVAQQVATGFNRNHPINSEAGEEPDEYRSAYVMDRVNTTATAFMGLTLECAQCHDHKYDPISQKDYYRFYDFFNHIDERDSGRSSAPRPAIAVPEDDEAPRLATLERKLGKLEARLEAEDPLTDADQEEWEKTVLEFIGAPVAWTIAEPIGMIAHHGSVLRRLEDGSILSTGTPPVRDTYDLVLKPGAEKITAMRIEVLPDPSQPEGGSGRATDGRFVLSGVKMRVSTLSDASDPPLVSIARASADLNQEPPEDRVLGTMTPGDIEGSIIVSDDEESGFGRGRRGGWSIIGDERARPHEAVLLPTEPLDLNDVSILHLSLVHRSRPYKSLIGRFRVSYTTDPRIREHLLPTVSGHWSQLGPFPAKDLASAFDTVFEPEKDIEEGMDLRKKYVQPQVPKEDPKKSPRGGKGGGPPSKDGASVASAGPAGSPGKDAKEAPEAAPSKGSGPPTSSVADADAADTVAGAPPGKRDEPGEAVPNGAGESPADTAVARADGSSAKKGGSKKSDAEKGTDGASLAKVDTGKASPAKPGTAKTGTTKAATAKPGDAEPGAPTPAGAPGGGSAERPPREVKLAWEEQREWRDGRRFRVEGEDAAVYLTREITSTRARTAVLELPGGDGIQVWLNGRTILRVPPQDRNASRGRSGPSGLTEASARGESEERRVTIGLRAGENELVAKVVIAKPPPRRGRGAGGGEEGDEPDFVNPDNPNFMGGGGDGRERGGAANLTFTLSPEGDDVLDHEVITALRHLHREPEIGAPDFSSAELDDSRSGPHADPAAAAIEPAVASVEKADAELAAIETRMRDAVRSYYRENVDEVGRVIARERRAVERELSGLRRRMPQAMVMEERDEPRETRMFIRGVYNQLGERVTAGTPAVLPPMAEDLPRNRLGLAQWLVAPEHPLTARVAVNRVWQQYFGTGLVGTPGDFGVRGELPSHPELLDWLAVEFRESGWDLKRLHRAIVLSRTYRQDSRRPAQAHEFDPDNRHLAAGPRQRLSAEMIRDHALAVSGLLVEEIGGRSVKPYQPAGLYRAVSGGRDYRADRDERQYRRGIYVYWKRGVPYPSFVTFDAPKRETCTMERVRTTTPLQALVLLNDPVYVEAAKKLGERMLTEGGEDDRERIRFGFRLCTSREPTERELAILDALLAEERRVLADDEKTRDSLLKIGTSKVDEKLDPLELAAWMNVARALLNLDATIHRG